MLSDTLFVTLSFGGHLVAAVACALAAVWLARRGDPARPDYVATVAVLILFALWGVFAATTRPLAPIVMIAETARVLATLWLLLRLFATDGRDESVRLVRPVAIVLLCVELTQPVLMLLALKGGSDMLVFQISTAMRMLVATGALVLLHNLYSGATGASRILLRSTALGLACLWGFELNYYTLAWLGGQPPTLLTATRGFAVAMIAVLLAVGGTQAIAGLEFRPSRKVTFQTLSLLIVCGYILAMLVLARSLEAFGTDLSRFTQVAFLAAASLVALLWLPSERLRAWLRVTASKHLFAHRYDYREEWLRFTNTVGRTGGAEETLQQRVVKALCDITDSPSGMLLSPNEEAELELMARWNWPDLKVPARAAPYQLSGLLEQHSYIVNLDELRRGIDRHGEAAHVPDWLTETADAWAVVPLLHYGRLIGAVVLARPAAQRPLDWEDLDLLRVVGQQSASYLAEQSGQEALMESSRFDEFNRRIAFVMHDIKNLASQLSLLARNAEKHAENPDFRQDMLVTLKNSSDKLNALIARLSRYGSGQAGASEPIDLTRLSAQVAARFMGLHPVETVRAEECLVHADPEGLEQALIHLVQNAVDASPPEAPVYIEATNDGMFGRVEIVDSGHGMSPGFIRNGLFKPFVSSKDGGFGIGALEARELVRAMGGQLDVESREGLGTRFTMKIPKFSSGSADVSTAEPTTQSKVA